MDNLNFTSSNLNVVHAIQDSKQYGVPLTYRGIIIQRGNIAMLLGLFKNVLDTPKVVHFWRIRTGVASFLESSSNMELEQAKKF